LELKELLVDLDPPDELERLALGFFREWDGLLTEDTVGGTVYEALLHELGRLVVENRLGRAADLFLSRGGDGALPVVGLTYRFTSRLIELLRYDDAAGLLENGLSAAVSDLKTRLGPDVLRWQWGRLHRLTFRHLLARRRPLGRLLNRGPFPMPGDGCTIFQSAHLPSRPFEVLGWTVSYRQVIDLGDWSNCWSALAPGQSGDRFSPHYADQIDGWRRLDYHPMLFHRSEAMNHFEAALHLEPASRAS
jgi:penicillin amidase